MAPKTPPIQQTNPQAHDSRFDILRTELDGKIEKKLSAGHFFSIIGVLVVIAGSILAHFSSQIKDLGNKLDDLKTRIIILETKIENHKK